MEYMLVSIVFAMNLLGYYVMYEDKRRARKDLYRISERSLWLIAFFGGAIGTTIGMFKFRHKTKRWSFKIGFTLLAGWQVFSVLFSIVLSFYAV